MFSYGQFSSGPGSIAKLHVSSSRSVSNTGSGGGNRFVFWYDRSSTDS